MTETRTQMTKTISQLTKTMGQLTENPTQLTSENCLKSLKLKKKHGEQFSMIYGQLTSNHTILYTQLTIQALIIFTRIIIKKNYTWYLYLYSIIEIPTNIVTTLKTIR